MSPLDETAETTENTDVACGGEVGAGGLVDVGELLGAAANIIEKSGDEILVAEESGH